MHETGIYKELGKRFKGLKRDWMDPKARLYLSFFWGGRRRGKGEGVGSG